MFDNYVNKLMTGAKLKKSKNMCKITFIFSVNSMIASVEAMQEKKDKNDAVQIYLRAQKEFMQHILRMTNEGAFDIKG